MKRTSARALGGSVLLVAAVLGACGRDPDDSGRGGPPVEPVAFIESADGPLWLGAPPARGQLDASVLDSATLSVVAVRARGCGAVSHGSAFAVAPGLLVGTAHVVTGAASVEIASAVGGDAELDVHEATVVGYDATRDLVLLRSHAELRPLPLGRLRLGITGAVVGYVSGASFGAAPDVSPARIEHFVSATGLWGEGADADVYLVAASIAHGQSGGPLVDRDGRVVGVAFGAATATDGVGFALGGRELVGFLLSTGVDVRLDYLGDFVVTADPANFSEVATGECDLR